MAMFRMKRDGISMVWKSWNGNEIVIEVQGKAWQLRGLKMKFISAASVLIWTSFFLGTCIEARSEARDQVNRVFTIESAAIKTVASKVHHDRPFDFEFAIQDIQKNIKLNIKLTLEPNHNILGEDSYVEYLDLKGNVRHAERIHKSENRAFKGTAWVEEGLRGWREAGWARVFVKKDGEEPLLEGAFSIFGDHHHIQSRSSYMQTKRDVDFHPGHEVEENMVIYRDSDMAPVDTYERGSSPARCPSDQLSFNTALNHPIFAYDERSLEFDSFNTSSNAKRQSPGGTGGSGNLANSIGSTAGCPTTARVALVGIATDCSYTSSFSTTQAVRENLISMVNTASDVYERTFNITLGLQNLTISDAQCPTTANDATPWNVACSSGDIESRLAQFSAWRGARPDTNAYWTLMSTCNSGGTVGIAWLGQLCVARTQGSGSQVVTGANVVVRTPGEWQVFAHESGHTFGAVHDCDSTICATGQTSQCCPSTSTTCDSNGQFLMNPSSSRGMTEFSPCTVGNICSALGSNRVISRCLRENRNVPTINGAQCGNGIVEGDEECDCGGPSGCGSNPCCNPTTCRFQNTAVCDDSNEACCSSCQFSPVSTVCRASKGPCDLQEVCSGSSGSCPADEYQPNGGKCGNDDSLFCAQGKCTSRDLQCQEVVVRGTGNNYTQSCGGDSCTLRCSWNSASFCSSINRNYLDGTPCDDGLCSSGRCSSGSSGGGSSGGGSSGGGSSGGGNGSSNWFDRHRTLVIGLAAGLGSLVLLILVCSIIACRRKSRKRSQIATSVTAPPMGYQFQGVAPPYPSPAYANFMNRPNNPTLIRYA